MAKKYRLDIGIDPDLRKSGYAISRKNKLVECDTIKFFDLINRLHKLSLVYPDMKVYIEAGWLNKPSNWRKSKGRGIDQKIAKDVGRNQGAGLLIEEYCKDHSIDYRLIRPTKGKVDKVEFKRWTGWSKRSSQDARDAGMLLFRAGRIKAE